MDRLRIPPELLSASLAGARSRLADGGSLAALPWVLDDCNRLLAGAGCGVLLEDPESGLGVGASTGSVSRALEETQVRVGEGPCVDAFVTASAVATADLHGEARWPGLQAELDRVPVRGVLGVPVHLDGIPVGAVDVFASSPRDWDPSEQEALWAFSGVLGSLLETVLRAAGSGDSGDRLRRARASRVAIERAVGYLMCRDRLDAPGAFGRLRSAARANRQGVLDLADRFLAGDGPVL